MVISRNARSGGEHVSILFLFALHYLVSFFYLMLGKRDEELCKADPNRKRSHFFKSFFMTTMLNEGHSDPSMDG